MGVLFNCLVGCFSMIVWTPAVLSVLYACVWYFCVCTCSAQLSMFHMERHSRNTLIVIIIIKSLESLYLSFLQLPPSAPKQNFLDSYLTQRNPTNAGNNPWFEEWFQHTLNCYTTPSRAGDYPVPCGANLDLRTNVIEDNGVLHVMNAVYSAAYALDATLRQKCGKRLLRSLPLPPSHPSFPTHSSSWFPFSYTSYPSAFVYIVL